VSRPAGRRGGHGGNWLCAAGKTLHKLAAYFGGRHLRFRSPLARTSCEPMIDVGSRTPTEALYIFRPPFSRILRIPDLLDVIFRPWGASWQLNSSGSWPANGSRRRVGALISVVGTAAVGCDPTTAARLTDDNARLCPLRAIRLARPAESGH
jgi:hypothetical protein